METKEIKEMNKEERLARAIMLANTYKQLMIYDIVNGNKFGEEMWKEYFLNAIRIAQNIAKMRGDTLDIIRALQ